MLFKYDYWYFTSGLPEKICDDIVKYALSKKEVEGVTGTGDKSKSNNDKKIRNSDLVWLNERWIYNEIHPFIYNANKNAGWNFQWDWSESLQFTKYKLNQHYDWHQDAWDRPYEKTDSNFNGKIRKLSISIILSDENDYEGGDFQIDFRHKFKDQENYTETVKQIKPKGSVIVFPSYIWHKVTPVTSGTRYSLVNWVLGQPYR